MTNDATRDIAEARSLLHQFDCGPGGEPGSGSGDRPEAQATRAALQHVIRHSDYQILGICAESLDQGQAALVAYAAALGYTVDVTRLAPQSGPVYIKFNPKTNLLYSDRYVGDHRGVLVSCQSAEPDDVNDMFGHLPLDLFDPL
jgi:hypothetical protein